MAIKIYRTILEQSNPAIIREFRMDDNRTCRELLYTIALIHGWETDDISIKKALTLNEELQPEDKKISWLGKCTKINIPCRKRYAGDMDEYWTFRLEELPVEAAPPVKAAPPAEAAPPVEAAPLTEPALLWYRGLNPSQECRSVSSWNTLHLDMLTNNASSDYQTSIFLVIENQMVNQEQINKNLIYQIQQGHKPIKLNKKRSQPLATVFEYSKVSDLKEVVRLYQLPASLTLRKNELAQKMAKVLNTSSTWQRIVKEMTLEEYRDFTAICTGEYLPGTIEITPLKKRCMISRGQNYWEDEKIPSELIDYYGELVYKDQNRQILKTKKFETVLEACCLLYGIFSLGQTVVIAERMFPGEFTQTDIRSNWEKTTTDPDNIGYNSIGYNSIGYNSIGYNNIGFNNAGTYPESSYALLNPETMYCARIMNKKTAEEIYRNQEKNRIPYYTPSCDELIKIVENGGCNFPAAALKEITPQINRILTSLRRSTDEAGFIVKKIYEMYHLGYNRTLIERELQTTYNLTAPRETYRRLFSSIEKYTNRIRLISLRGNMAT